MAYMMYSKKNPKTINKVVENSQNEDDNALSFFDVCDTNLSNF